MSYKYIIKHICIGALTGLAMSVVFLMVYFGTCKVKAADNDIPATLYTQSQNWGHTIYQLSDGNYYYQTQAKTRTSSVCHLTIAIEVSRIKDGINQLSSPYV